MKNWEDMVEYYKDHPKECDAILKHAGLLNEEPMKENRQTNPDEIVLENVKLFHLESMIDNEALWIGCYTEDNKVYHLNITVKDGKLYYYWSDETT